MKFFPTTYALTSYTIDSYGIHYNNICLIFEFLYSLREHTAYWYNTDIVILACRCFTSFAFLSSSCASLLLSTITKYDRKYRIFNKHRTNIFRLYETKLFENLALSIYVRIKIARIYIASHLALWKLKLLFYLFYLFLVRTFRRLYITYVSLTLASLLLYTVYTYLLHLACSISNN